MKKLQMIKTKIIAAALVFALVFTCFIFHVLSLSLQYLPHCCYVTIYIVLSIIFPSLEYKSHEVREFVLSLMNS